jgi:hypothetical protein
MYNADGCHIKVFQLQTNSSRRIHCSSTSSSDSRASRWELKIIFQILLTYRAGCHFPARCISETQNTSFSCLEIFATTIIYKTNYTITNALYFLVQKWREIKDLHTVAVYEFHTLVLKSLLKAHPQVHATERVISWHGTQYPHSTMK